MCYNDNIPAGSQNDSRAPWNEKEPTLCPYCDKEEIEYSIYYEVDRLVDECFSKHPDITPEYEKMIDAVEHSIWENTTPCYFHSMDY